MSQQPIIDTIRLLMLHESQDEAELLLNSLRKAGKAARGEIVRDEAGLVSHLKAHEWDLVLGRIGGKCTPARMAELAGKHAPGVPLVLLADNHDPATVVAGIKAGAQDVVARDSTEHLVLVVNREMANLAMRREMHRLEADLRETQKRTELLMDTARDAVAYVTDGMHVQANDAYLELFGYKEADDLAGVPVMDLVAEASHKELKELLRRQLAAKNGEAHEITCKCLHSDGHEFEATMAFSPANYDGEPCTQILIRTQAAASGVSDEEMEARLKAMSSQDSLTGLRNRQYFMEQVDAAVAQAKRGKTYTVFFIQIDNFTTLRTSVGIGGADTVLTEVASLLRGLIPDSAGLLARFGDDVFAAMVGSGDVEKARKFGEQMRKTVADHLFEVQKKTLQVTVSVGATVVDKDVPNGQEALTRAADAGLRVRQKNEAGNGVFVSRPDDFIDANTDSGMARHLQTALEKNQFKLYWQPILNLEDNGEETYEVLLRLPFQDKELQPAEFLQAASAGNLNTKIDRWVILHALKQLSDHQAKGHKTRIMVTLTSDSLADASLVQWLGVALKAARADGKSLILQFTEADAGTYLKAARDFALAVQAQGISTAITRFGTGGANAPKVLPHLNEVAYVKLDGSFVQEINSEAGKQAISRVIKDAKSHSKKVIASHVESAAALQVLWGFGIDYIEGYYVSPPLGGLTYAFSEA
jgi:diguanylate cyclase (GGDEF)-like protein/PAS domain S-box-containing protein